MNRHRIMRHKGRLLTAKRGKPACRVGAHKRRSSFARTVKTTRVIKARPGAEIPPAVRDFRRRHWLADARRQLWMIGLRTNQEPEALGILPRDPRLLMQFIDYLGE